MRVVVLATTLTFVSGAAGATPQADPVTLSLRQYTNENKVRVLVWYGQVASTAGGQDVEVLGRDCLTSFYRQLTATTTLPGGGWETESLITATFPPTSVDVSSGTTFRARLVHTPTLDYGGAYNYQAVFKVTAPGLQLRAYLPAASAAPCYAAGASKPWRS